MKKKLLLLLAIQLSIVFAIVAQNGVVDKSSETSLKYYPNPAKTHLFVEVSNWNEDNYIIVITSIIGKQVLNLAYSPDFIENRQKLDISSLENGNYFVELIANNQVISTSKLWVEK